jgi:hypothetical protein
MHFHMWEGSTRRQAVTNLTSSVDENATNMHYFFLVSSMDVCMWFRLDFGEAGSAGRSDARYSY